MSNVLLILLITLIKKIAFVTIQMLTTSGRLINVSVALIAWNTPLQKINASANQDSSTILCQRLVLNGFAVQLTLLITRFKEEPIVSLVQCGRPVMARTDV